MKMFGWALMIFGGICVWSVVDFPFLSWRGVSLVTFITIMAIGSRIIDVADHR